MEGERQTVLGKTTGTRIVGVGAVAPGGIGSRFQEAVLRGEVGIQDYHERLEKWKPLAIEAENALAMYLGEPNPLLSHHGLPILHLFAQGPRPSLGCLELFDFYAHWLPLAAAISRTLPVYDITDPRCPVRAALRLDIVPGLPRTVRYAVLSTFLGLLDAMGRLADWEEEIFDAWGKLDLDKMREGAVCSREIVPVLERLSQTADDALSEVKAWVKEHKAGLITGCAAGSPESVEHYVTHLHKMGLTSNHEGQRSEDPNLVVLFPEMLPSAHNSLPAAICLFFGLSGEQSTLSSACCAGLAALLTAHRTLMSEDCDSEVIVATGTDCCLWPELLYPYLALQAKTPPSQPYSPRSEGWAFGEGAGTLVLSRRDDKDGGVRVLGGAMRNANTQRPDAPEKREVLEAALRLVASREGPGVMVGYGLGDGQRAGKGYDGAELANLAQACATELPGRSVPVISIKGTTGHAMAGSSALAAVFAAELLRGGPGTLDARPPGHDLNSPAQPCFKGDRLPRPAWAVLNGTGLGGTCCAVALESERP